MSLYEKMVKSFDGCTLDAYLVLLHLDYGFARHQSGEEISKDDWVPAVTGIYNSMSDDKLTYH